MHVDVPSVQCLTAHWLELVAKQKHGGGAGDIGTVKATPWRSQSSILAMTAASLQRGTATAALAALARL
jgi:hypothetical protein